MDNLIKIMNDAKRFYDVGENPFDTIIQVNDRCLELLSNCSFSNIANCDDKEYWVYKNGDSISRPIRKDLLLSRNDFCQLFKNFENKGKNIYSLAPISGDEINKVLYTAISNFCACFDLFKRGSRKTPGTYFEILLGTIFSHFLFDYNRKKFIKLPEFVSDSGDNSGADEDSVSTDIVFEKRGFRSFIFPAKITTRERIVQPFAHQRILDSAFGESKYLSFILCVSEMQLDKDSDVHPVCVPGTIKLFQRHLAHVGGIFYLDPPKRYLAVDVKTFIVVDTIGNLLETIIHEHIVRLPDRE